MIGIFSCLFLFLSLQHQQQQQHQQHYYVELAELSGLDFSFDLLLLLMLGAREDVAFKKRPGEGLGWSKWVFIISVAKPPVLCK